MALLIKLSRYRRSHVHEPAIVVSKDLTSFLFQTWSFPTKSLLHSLTLESPVASITLHRDRYTVYIYTHTCIHVLYTHTHTHTHTHTYVHIITCYYYTTLMLIHMYTYMQTLHARTYVIQKTCKHFLQHIHTHTYTHIHVYIHACIHLHTHT